MSNQLSVTEKWQIVCRKLKKETTTSIAKKFKVSISQVNKIFKRYNETENVVVAKKRGRPKEFTERQKRHITKMVKTGGAQNVLKFVVYSQ